jgi:Ca2+-binding EF-hand superfamily protein
MNSDSKISMGNTLKKKNKINEKAIISYKEELEQRQNDEIKEVFNLFDTERKGIINGHNMKICFKTLGIDIKQKEVEDLVKQVFNKDITQTFKYDEFFQLAKKKLNEKDQDLEYEKQFFLLCDYNPGDEREVDKLTLNKEYLTELAKNVGESMSSEEIDEMIQIVAGEDGTINKNQFIEFMKNPIEYKSGYNISGSNIKI